MRALKRYRDEKESFRRFSEETDRVSAEFRREAKENQERFANSRPVRERKTISQSPWFDVFRDNKL